MSCLTLPDGKFVGTPGALRLRSPPVGASAKVGQHEVGIERLDRVVAAHLALQLSREVLDPRHPTTLLVQLNGVSNLAALGLDEAAVRQLAAMEPQTLIWLGSELYSSEAPGVRTHLVASQATYQDVAISLAPRPNAGPDAARTA